MSTQDQLPNSFEAEQGVLASLIYAPYLISQIADKLKPEDFYFHSYRHPELYEAMRHLYYQEIEIDTATLQEQLKQKSITEIHGTNALSYIADLWQQGLERGPSLFDDMKIMLNLATKRKEIEFLEKAKHLIEKEPDAQKVLILMQALLTSINENLETSDLKPLSAIMDDFMIDLGNKSDGNGKITGIPTGLDDLDVLLGGLQRGEMIVLGGQSGEGKTSLALNFLYHLIIKLQLHVAMFSLEMPELDLARRLISMDTGIDSQLIRTRMLQDWQWEKIGLSALGTLYKDHVFIDDSGDLTPASMRSKLDRYKARHGLDLVIVDYLQLMQGDDEDTGKYHETETQQLSKISRGLKKIAKLYDVPVLTLVSLNRASKSRADKRPQLSDIRGSGSIGFDADVVMFIMRSRERTGYSLVNVEKHRNGPIGDVILKFNPTLTRFSNADDMEEETAQ